MPRKSGRCHSVVMAGLRSRPTTAAPLPEFFVRVEKEQDAGQYLWDVYAFGTTLEMFALKNKGGLAPTRDYLVGPDVGTDADSRGPGASQ